MAVAMAMEQEQRPMQGQRKRLETFTERRAVGEAVIDHAPRCFRCNKPIAWMVTRPWRITCRACLTTNCSPTE
jgi:hypothetical protein